MPFPSSAAEQQLKSVRTMLRHLEAYATLLAGISPGLAHAEVEDAIADGEYLLKQLGGVAARTAPRGPMVASGLCVV